MGICHNWYSENLTGVFIVLAGGGGGGERKKPKNKKKKFKRVMEIKNWYKIKKKKKKHNRV